MIYVVIVAIISIFFLYTNFLEQHNMLLEQRQWAYVNTGAYVMWGVGLAKTIREKQRKR